MATLRLSGLDLPDGQDPLGMWDLSSLEHYAFSGTTIPAPADTLLWQVQIERATVHTRLDMRHQLEELASISRSLHSIQAHIEGLNVHSYPAYALEEVDNPFAEYDSVLLEQLHMLRPSQRAYAPDEMEYVGFDQTLVDRCQRLYTQFKRILAYKTWIETDVHGFDVGLTAVDWGGDFTNVWSRNVNADQRKAHMDAVKVALRSRQTTMQLIVVVSAGALGLALKAGIPGGQLLLLPSVYDYVRNVLQAWKDWRANQQGQQS